MSWVGQVMSVVILVGTETGNAMDLAERARDDLFRFGIKSCVVLMNDFDLSNMITFDYKCFLFICSTTGDGEIPKNMQKFWVRLCQATLPPVFSNLAFGVFGLGDSSYEKYNYTGKKVYRRIIQLGGNDLLGRIGLGDDNYPRGGLEAGWSKWWNEIKFNIAEKFPGNGIKFSEFEPLPPRTWLSFKPTSGSETNIIIDSSIIESTKLAGKVVSLDRITPSDHFQDVRLIIFHLKLPKTYTFEPGDVLNLLPCNDDSLVEELIELMGWSGEEMIFNEESYVDKAENPTSTSLCVKYPINLRLYLKSYIDLTSMPSKSCIRTLSTLCDVNAAPYSEMHREKLTELYTVDEEYVEYVWKAKRNVVEILRDFQPTIKINLERILQVFPKQKMRQYSIANDPALAGDGIGTWRVELCVALIKEKMPLGRGEREGLCSKWIGSGNIVNEFHTAPFTITKGSFHLHPQTKTYFLFATGTGIAPIRFLIQRLVATRPDCKIYLYFGFRSVEADFFFKEEWSQYPQNILTVFFAGSRDGVKGSSKIYLDTLIQMNAGPLQSVEDVSTISVHIAGHSRLGKLVTDTLNEIWSSSIRDNLSWTAWLQKHDLFQLETWS